MALKQSIQASRGLILEHKGHEAKRSVTSSEFAEDINLGKRIFFELTLFYFKIKNSSLKVFKILSKSNPSSSYKAF